MLQSCKVSQIQMHLLIFQGFVKSLLWNQNWITFVIRTQMGLTGIDSKCKDWARMQAGVCTALKDSYEP